MLSREECMEQAVECQDLSETATTALAKDNFLSIAIAWKELAAKSKPHRLKPFGMWLNR